MSYYFTGNCSDFAGATCHKPTPYITWDYNRNSLGGIGKEESVPGIGQELFYLFLLGLGFQVILILLEYGFVQRVLAMVFKTKSSAFHSNSQDEDVEVEAKRVHDLVNKGRTNQYFDNKGGLIFIQLENFK